MSESYASAFLFARFLTMAFDDHSIPPFWSRIPRFFAFPLHPAVLARVWLYGAIPAIAALATGINSMAIAGAGLSLLAWILFLRYGSRVLSETALGRLSPADYAGDEDESLKFLPYRIFGLFFIASLAVGVVAGLFGEGAGFAANGLATLMLPAAFMVLVHTRSLSAGLNPGHAWAVVSAMGKAYLLLCLFLFCLSSGQAFLTMWLASHGILPIWERWAELQASLGHIDPDDDGEAVMALFAGFDSYLKSQRPRLFMSIFAFTAAGMYFTLIAFNMMGYALYQYHRRLGIAVDEGRAGEGGAVPGEDDEIAALIAAGQLDRAVDIAYEAQRLDMEDLAAQERYHKLLHLAGKDERMFSHARRLLALLMRKNQPAKALEVVRRCREKDAEFRPDDPALVLALAEAARRGRDPRFALELMRRFDGLFNGHPLIPDIYFLSACILCEDLRQDQAADRLFEAVCRRYPDHPLAGRAQEFRATLARLGSNAAG